MRDFSRHDLPQRPRKRKVGVVSRHQVDQVRRLVYARDHDRCVAAGDGTCDGPLTIQHATARGMGGSAKFDGPQYLRTFCLDHNVRETADAAFAQRCERSGWRVPRMRYPDLAAAILLVPVLYPDGTWWTLDASGGRTEVFDAADRWRILGAPWAADTGVEDPWWS